MEVDTTRVWPLSYEHWLATHAIELLFVCPIPLIFLKSHSLPFSTMLHALEADQYILSHQLFFPHPMGSTGKNSEEERGGIFLFFLLSF